MGRIVSIILILSAITVASCNKPEPTTENIQCFTGNWNCSKDTTIFDAHLLPTPDSNCAVLDAVNIDQLVSTVSSMKLGDSTTLYLNALGISSNATGKIMFVRAYKDKHIEVKTFIEYDKCKQGTQVLQGIPAPYAFKPKEKGTYEIVFINVYGTSNQVSITVN